MATSEPMSDARLAEIRELVDNINARGRYSGAVSPSEVMYASDAGDLLAEVERQQVQILFMQGLIDVLEDKLGNARAELAAAQATIARLRPVVEAVVALATTVYGVGDDEWFFPGDDVSPVIEQARAALEGEAGQ